MKTLKFAFLISLSFFVFSCGGDDKKKSEKEKVKIGNSQSSEGSKTEASVTVELLGNDLMQFDKKLIRVKEGQEVTLVLKHTGKMAKNIMGHNFVLLNPGVDLQAFGLKASAAKDTDYIPENAKDVIAHTKMIGGGETTSITFNAPAPGEYDFICSFPGHYGVMQGKFIVE